MGFFKNFPYTNFHEMNLEWILREMQNIKKYIENYTAINKVSYAGIWDITKQYPQWAVVTDGETSWLSLKPVPAGIPLENEDYWQKLADLDPRIAGIIVQLGETVKKAETVADMKNMDCNPGDIVQTMGYHKKGVGCGLYVIERGKVANEHTVIAMKNGLFAVLLDDPSNVLTIGAHADGVTDDTEIFQWAVDNVHNVHLPAGKYLLNGTVKVAKSCAIRGERTTLDFESSQNYTGTAIYCNYGFEITTNGVDIEDIGFFKSVSGGKGNCAIHIKAEEGHHVNLKRLFIEDFSNGVNVTGTIFASVFESLFINGCTNGFRIDGSATSTCCTWLNCWTTWCDNGYNLDGVVYSNMISCASDHCGIGYKFYNLQNFDCINCGCEQSTNESETCVFVNSCKYCQLSFLFAGNVGPYLISCSSSNHMIFANCNVSTHSKAIEYVIGDWSAENSGNVAYNTNPGNTGATSNIINGTHTPFQTLSTK